MNTTDRRQSHGASLHTKTKTISLTFSARTYIAAGVPKTRGFVEGNMQYMEKVSRPYLLPSTFRVTSVTERGRVVRYVGTAAVTTLGCIWNPNRHILPQTFRAACSFEA